MGGLFVLVLMLLGLIVALIGVPLMLLQRKRTNSAAENNQDERGYRRGNPYWEASESGYFWMSLIGGIVFVLFGFILLLMSFKTIDAGEVGVQTRFGEVLEETLTEGFNSKSPFVNVHTYSVRVNEYTMSGVQGQGDVMDPDSIRARTRDDLLINIDMTIRWSVDPTSAGIVYRTISPNMAGITDIVVRPSSRSLARDIVPQYSLNELNQNRAQVTQAIFEPLAQEFAAKGLLLDSVLIRDIHPPADIDRAIQQKLAREQELQEQEYKRQIAEQEAEIRRIEAQGIADAQEIIQAELTPIYVQYEAIQAYKELAGSPNTTFVIMPTGPDGAGMPLILGN